MPDANGGTVTSLTSQARQMQGPWGFGFYGPGSPLPPVTPDADPRQWDFAPGTNMTFTPRHMEPYGFANLRAFSNVELVRMAIETRKDQLERLDWMVKPKDNSEARKQAKNGGKRDQRILDIEKFLAKPDGVTAFGSFCRALDEDLLALDAPAIELRRTRGGKLLGLELVDGATINLLVDGNGRRPRDPNVPAFQQIIRGMVWANLTNRELLYLPRNVRTGHIYGFGPVEQIVVTINTIIRRQASQLAYFTSGNVPAGILNAPDGWTNQQIRDLQTWFDTRIAGNTDQQRSLIWVPKDAKYQAFKDSPIKDEFDEWLARLVAFAFSLPPTPFVRQMNKGTANEDQDRALEEGLEPLKIHRKRWIDDLLANEFGADDLEFAWREDVDIDPAKQAELDDKRLRNGSATLDEVRDRAGDEPYPNGVGAKPMIYLATGPVPLDRLDELTEQKLNPPTPTMVGPDGKPIPQGKPGAQGGPPPVKGKEQSPKAKDGEQPSSAPGSKKNSKSGSVAKGRSIPKSAFALSVDRPSALKAAAKLEKEFAKILADVGKHVAESVKHKLHGLNKADPTTPPDDPTAISDSIDLSGLLRMAIPLKEEATSIAKESGKLTLVSIGVEDPLQLVDQVNESAVEWARDHIAELFSGAGEANESLVESTRAMLRQIITDGLDDNIGRDAIAEKIESSLAFSEYRANMIANTEIAFANAAGKQEAWDAVRASTNLPMVKQWFVSEDEGVCDECEGNADQGEIPLEEEFESGDDAEPAHPNCRCVTTARVVDADEVSEGEGEEE